MKHFESWGMVYDKLNIIKDIFRNSFQQGDSECLNT